MSCFLCNSVYHLSHNCDIHASDEERQEILVSKNWCPNCFSHVSEVHAKKWERCRVKNNKKCFFCFSREHHTVFCTERFTVSNMIVPAIDKELHERFFRLFNGRIEQYQLAFLSKEMFDRINSWPKDGKSHFYGLRITNQIIKLFDTLKNENHARAIIENSPVILITNEVNLDGVDTNSYIYKNILRPRPYDYILFQVKKIILHNCDITDKSLLRLLSHYTKILECRHLKLDQNVAFSDIIQRLPNIEELILHETSIIPDESWADNLLRFKSSNNFLKLEMQIYSYKFNAKSLATFIKTKSIKNVKLILNVINPDNDDKGHEKELSDKLSGYFETENKKRSILCFNSVKTDDNSDKKFQMFASFTKLNNE